MTSVAHPQANGQTEVSNRTLVQGIKKQLGKANGNQVDKLPEFLWSYQTTPRTSTKETPFSLAYGAEYCQEQENDDNQRENLDLLEEQREHSIMRQAA